MPQKETEEDLNRRLTLPFCKSGKVAGLKPDPKRSFFFPNLAKNFYAFCSGLFVVLLFPGICSASND